MRARVGGRSEDVRSTKYGIKKVSYAYVATVDIANSVQSIHYTQCYCYLSTVQTKLSMDQEGQDVMSLEGVYFWVRKVQKTILVV